jgi:hypothetical protein
MGDKSIFIRGSFRESISIASITFRENPSNYFKRMLDDFYGGISFLAGPRGYRYIVNLEVVTILDATEFLFTFLWSQVIFAMDVMLI